MVKFVVYSLYSIIFCVKMVEPHTFAVTDTIWGNAYWNIYVN